MGIKGRADWEERKNESGGMEERIGRKGRTDREKGASTSGGTRKYQQWYTKVPPMVFSLVLSRIQEKTTSSAGEHYVVCQRTLRRLPENTTSSAGEHYIVHRRTPIRFSPSDSDRTHPFSTRKTGNRAKILRRNRNLTQNLTHQNSLSINE